MKSVECISLQGDFCVMKSTSRPSRPKSSAEVLRCPSERQKRRHWGFHMTYRNVQKRWDGWMNEAHDYIVFLNIAFLKDKTFKGLVGRGYTLD